MSTDENTNTTEPDGKAERGHQPLKKGYQPLNEGYHPGQGNLDSSNPPQGGTGVPSKQSGGNGKKNE